MARSFLRFVYSARTKRLSLLGSCAPAKARSEEKYMKRLNEAKNDTGKHGAITQTQMSLLFAGRLKDDEC